MHPIWMYHRVHGARLIATPAAHEALDADWRDTPAHFLNLAADCCDAAAASRGYQHAEMCLFDAAAADSEDATGVATSPKKRPTRAELRERAAAKG